EHGGEPVTLTLTMRYDDLANQVGQATLDNQERVPAAQVRQLACNAGIIPLVLGEKSQPMDIGRKTRTFPAGIRRVLVTRDRGCAFPGLWPTAEAVRRPPCSSLGGWRCHLGRQRGPAVPPPPHTDPPQRVDSADGPRHTDLLPTGVARPATQAETQSPPHRSGMTGGPTGSPAMDVGDTR
ncbi:DUF222 domain-containing protein, partial [Lentzea terrae]